MQELMQKLREANDARHAVWPGATKADLAFATIEFGGEAGEAVEAADNFTSSPLLGEDEYNNLKQAYAEEVGDVIISMDLMARELGIIISGEGITESLKTALQHSDASTTYILRFAGTVGLIMDGVKKYLRHQLGISGNKLSISDITGKIGSAMDEALLLIVLAARDAGIDVVDAVPMKFNKTSAKVGVPSFMNRLTWGTQVTA